MVARPQLLTIPSQLGAVLRSSRRARRLSQTELARRIGLSQARVSYLEQHPQDVSFEQLMAWCSALGLELYVAPKGNGPESRGTSTPAW